VDADNYTGKDFAVYLNKHFLKHPKSYLAVDYYSDDKRYKDSYGRVACNKKDFMAVRGYDEQMIGYGYEDIDFCERLSRSGVKRYNIESEIYLKSISHSHEERQAHEPRSGQIHIVYIQYIDPFRSRIIYLFNDQTFSMATLLDNQEGFGNPTLEEKRWVSGSWISTDEQLELIPYKRDNMIFKINSDGHLIDVQEKLFYRITDGEFGKKLRMHYPIITNHQQYLNNKKKNIVMVNNKGFGCGEVIRNFKEKIVLDNM
jgi:hypothetical protein